MINNDADLKQMFDLTRDVDRALVPSFESLELTPRVRGEAELPVAARRSGGLAVSVVGTALVAASGLFGLAYLHGPASVEQVLVEDDLRELNELCESLLVAIHEPPDEMRWSTETDSLLPVEAVNFKLE